MLCYLLNVFMQDLLRQDIKFLPGVGPKRALLLNKELEVHTFGDLLYVFPYKYVDRTKFYKVAEVRGDMPYIQVTGKITAIEEMGEKRKKRMSARFVDETGELELVWFRGIQWAKQGIKLNASYVLFGKPALFNGRINIAHPELEEVGTESPATKGMLQAFYNTTEKMKRSFVNSRAILKLQYNLIRQLSGKIKETLPPYLIEKLKLISLSDALVNIHFPQNTELLRKAQLRLKFEELFYIQLKILSLKANRYKKFKGHFFSNIGYNFNTFYNDFLPFELTGAQKKVLKEIRKDTGIGHQMNRLLQGDVGSGKTLVALMTVLMAIDNGYQSCMMAPTEILANQHYATITKMLRGMPVNIGLLTGSTRQSERKKLHEQLLNGGIQLLIGTHALLEDTVAYKNLGLVIIDEQHRFGVAQRAKLWKKNTIPPHVLVMTATPIPRTLAMTIYGDLEVSVIDELPPGRKAIKTMHFFDKKRAEVFAFLKKQVAEGRQVYVVYPLIKESEKLSFKDLEQGYEVIRDCFPLPDYKVSMVHGQMKPAEKDEEMQKFVNGQTNIMVATTVIEVGVDVPNASVMVIESAEKFGLSQLHQLRGRVGRGTSQSYCILMSGYKLTNEARKRIETMVATNDGFEIAEVDLKLRGPGDMEGTQQSGVAFNMKIANLSKDGQLLQYARDKVNEILDGDALLEKPENSILKKQLHEMQKKSVNWSVIS